MPKATAALRQVHTQLDRLSKDDGLSNAQLGRVVRLDYKVTQLYGGSCEQATYDGLVDDAGKLTGLLGVGNFATIMRNTEGHADQVTPP